MLTKSAAKRRTLAEESASSRREPPSRPAPLKTSEFLVAAWKSSTSLSRATACRSRSGPSRTTSRAGSAWTGASLVSSPYHIYAWGDRLQYAPRRRAGCILQAISPGVDTRIGLGTRLDRSQLQLYCIILRAAHQRAPPPGRSHAEQARPSRA